MAVKSCILALGGRLSVDVKSIPVRTGHNTFVVKLALLSFSVENLVVKLQLNTSHLTQPVQT